MALAVHPDQARIVDRTPDRTKTLGAGKVAQTPVETLETNGRDHGVGARTRGPVKEDPGVGRDPRGGDNRVSVHGPVVMTGNREIVEDGMTTARIVGLAAGGLVAWDLRSSTGLGPKSCRTPRGRPGRNAPSG